MKSLLRYLRSHHIALAALFIALGGTSYAAVSLPKNSVGANQIRADAVTSAKVKDRSLLARDFKAGQLPKGAKGARGAKGATGARGATGAAGAAGAVGAVGPQGAKGDTGAQGPAGPVDSLSARVTRDSSAFPVASCTFVAPATSCAGAATTPLTFTTESYDVGDFFDPAAAASGGIPGAGQLTVAKSGTYHLAAGVRWAQNATPVAGVRSLSLSGPNVNPTGVTGPTPGVLAQSVVPANPDGPTSQNVSTLVRLNAGQKVYASVGQNSGASVNVVGSQGTVHLAATYVGP